MILGLSRIVVFAAITATAGAGAGLWYVLGEDERSAPVAQRESATSQETGPAPTATRGPGEATLEDETAQQEAAREEPEQEDVTAEDAGRPPSDEQGADIADAGSRADAPTGEFGSEEGTSEEASPAIGELFEEEVAALTDPAAPVPATESASAPAAEPEAAQPRLPAFDTVRVEPTGEAVIAGRDAPEGNVALLRDGEVYDETFAGPSGAFVFIPEPFPVGTSDVTLRAIDADGNVLMSRESITIIVEADRKRRPVVALTAPGRPTEVLSQPEPVQVAELSARENMAAGAQEPASRQATLQETSQEASQQAAQEPLRQAETDAATEAATTGEAETAIAAIDPDTQTAAETASDPVDPRAGVRIVVVEAETGGGLFVSGESEAQAAIRLYLNDTLVARAEADDTGDVSFAIRRGVRAGRYQVRLDDVDPETGTVLSRAEVGFTVPEAVATAPAPASAPASSTGPAPVERALQQAQTLAGAGGSQEQPARETNEPTGDAVAQAPSGPVAQTGDEADDAAPVATGEINAPPASGRTNPTVVVPELSTALVERGDSLWRISRQIYGRGIRYTEIFEANQQQIRNPDLIYPGQVFVLPQDEAGEEAVEEMVPAR